MKTLSSEIQFSGGTISLSGDYLIEGRINGRIEADGTIVVGPDAHVTGEILATKIVVEGRVEADIVARVRCELHSRSVVVGLISAEHLHIEEGADFSGTSRVGLNTLDSVLEELTENPAIQAA